MLFVFPYFSFAPYVMFWVRGMGQRGKKRKYTLNFSHFPKMEGKEHEKITS